MPKPNKTPTECSVCEHPLDDGKYCFSVANGKQFAHIPKAAPGRTEDWRKQFKKRFIRGYGPISNSHHDVIEADSWIEATPEELEDFISGLLEEKEEQKEIVICAAVKLHDGRIFRGHRHADCFAVMRGINPKIEWPNDNEQGFITSKNRFVTRQEGRKLQDTAGIPSASVDGYFGNTLYSEDLY